MECEQDPTLMEEKLIEGGGGVHIYANVTAMASSLNGLNCLTQTAMATLGLSGNW